MLRLAVVLTLVAVCFAQTPTRPNITETFTSTGGAEFHDNRGTFFGEFIIDRDQAKNEGVENATYKVGDVMEHFEVLERYDMQERYTVRFNGSGDEHCQVEKVTGNLHAYWGWIAVAAYEGKQTFHEVVYDVWRFHFSTGDELELLVPETDPSTPKFFRRRIGPVQIGYEFKTFMVTEPPPADFDVPKACTSPGRRINRVP